MKIQFFQNLLVGLGVAAALSTTTAAQVEFFGQGCAPNELINSTEPRCGETLKLHVRFVEPTTNVLFAFGTERLTIDLGPFGAPGCSLYTDILYMENRVADPAVEFGVTLEVYIPDMPELRGMTFFVQAAVAAPAANPMGLLTTRAAQVQLI